MQKERKQKLLSAKDAEIMEGPKGFFQVSGVTPTTLLDHFLQMSGSQQKKYNFFWQLLKANRPILGMLESKKDVNGLPYSWVVLGQLRGKQEFKIYLLAPGLLDYLINYQNGLVSVKFTLQELLDEAEQLEDEQSNSTSSLG